MARAYVSDVLGHPVAEVWSVLGDFHGLDRWVPTLVGVEAVGPAGSVGSLRRLHRKDGGLVEERLVRYDEPGRSLSYDFAGPIPFPVRHFTGTVQVRPVTATGGCFVEWSAEFDADLSEEDVARSALEEVFGRLLAALAAHLSNRVTHPEPDPA